VSDNAVDFPQNTQIRNAKIFSDPCKKDGKGGAIKNIN